LSGGQAGDRRSDGRHASARRSAAHHLDSAVGRGQAVTAGARQASGRSDRPRSGQSSVSGWHRQGPEAYNCSSGPRTVLFVRSSATREAGLEDAMKLPVANVESDGFAPLFADAGRLRPPRAPPATKSAPWAPGRGERRRAGWGPESMARRPHPVAWCLTFTGSIIRRKGWGPMSSARRLRLPAPPATGHGDPWQTGGDEPATETAPPADS